MIQFIWIYTWLKEELYRDGIDAFLQNCRILTAFAMRIHLNVTNEKITILFKRKGNT